MDAVHFFFLLFRYVCLFCFLALLAFLFAICYNESFNSSSDFVLSLSSTDFSFLNPFFLISDTLLSLFVMRPRWYFSPVGIMKVDIRGWWSGLDSSPFMTSRRINEDRTGSLRLTSSKAWRSTHCNTALHNSFQISLSFFCFFLHDWRFSPFSSPTISLPFLRNMSSGVRWSLFSLWLFCHPFPYGRGRRSKAKEQQ